MEAQGKQSSPLCCLFLHSQTQMINTDRTISSASDAMSLVQLVTYVIRGTSKYDKHVVILALKAWHLIPGVSSNSSPYWGQRECRQCFHWQKADSIWHLFGSITVQRLSVAFFLSLVPYLISFSLVSHAFERKGMLFLVLRYQHLSVSRDWQMVFGLR